MPVLALRPEMCMFTCLNPLRMRHLLLCVAGLAASLRLLAQPLPADSLPARWQPGITITAQRVAADPLDLPVALTILDSATLHQLIPRSTPEALIGQPGVWMQKTHHGGGSAFVRGLTGNQTLLLIDGIRVNNSTYRYGPNQYLATIDALSLGRIEVMQGAGSVQYGSDALGGTLNLFSRDLAFADSGYQWHGGTLLKYMSGDMERSLRAEVDMRSPWVATRIGLSYRDFGDLIAGGDLGVLAPSGYAERSADFKSCLRLAPATDLTLLWQQVTQRQAGRYDQVAQRGYRLWEFDPQLRQLAYARLVHRPGRPWLAQWQLTASSQLSVEGRRTQRETDSLLRQERDEVRTLGLSLEAVSRPRPAWEIVSGLEYYGDAIGSTAWLADSLGQEQARLRGLYPDAASAWSLAAFTLHRYQRAGWTLSAGLRGQLQGLYAFDPQFGDLGLRSPALVGQLGLLRRLPAGQRLGLSLHNGFRAPNINDLSSFGAFDSGIEVPTGQLAPERSLTGELIYKVRQPGLWGQASLWYTRLSDLITRVPATYQGQATLNGEPVFQKANVEAAFLTGLDLAAELALRDDWRAQGSLTYTYGQTLAAMPQPLRRIPPLFGRVALVYAGQQGWQGRAEFLLAGRQDRLSPGDLSDHRIPSGGSPAWEVLNLYLGYTFDRMQVQASLQNAFNEAYRMHGSGVDGVGRSAWLSVRVQF